MTHVDPELRLTAVQAISNVLYIDDASVIELVVQAGYIDNIVKILDNQSEEIVRIALWGLSNLVITDA